MLARSQEIVVLVVHLPAEGAHHAGDEERGLLQVAVGGLIVAAVVVGAGFRVQQYGGDHRLHIAAHALTVVVESRRDARNISGAGIALHQVLDQLRADERPDVRVIEDVVERVVQILQRSDAGRRDIAVEQLLRAGIMLRWIRNHGAVAADVRAPISGVPGCGAYVQPVKTRANSVTVNCE